MLYDERNTPEELVFSSASSDIYEPRSTEEASNS